MARQFSSGFNLIEVGAASGETWGPFTAAVVLLRNLGDATQPTLLSTASSSIRLSAFILGNGWIGWWNDVAGSGPNASLSFTNADGWVIAATSKAAGTAIPRFHKVPFNAAPSHADDVSAYVDATAPGAGGFWSVGAWWTGGDPFPGAIAAACYIPRKLSDSEIASMVRGDWWRFNPRFWREYPSGIDNPAVLDKTIGSDRTKDVSTTGTTRTALRDPPGFRFSLLNRRR